MGEGVDLGVLAGVTVDSAETSEGVDSLNVHGARAANAFSARPAEGESGVVLVLDLDERVENLR